MRTSDNEFVGPPERTYKVVFAGDAAVGKSTFIVRLCKGCFVTNIASTLGKLVRGMKEGGEEKWRRVGGKVAVGSDRNLWVGGMEEIV